MKHLGDITKISGFSIEPVDVITGGSPCQDLSIAGKRAGLEGQRSGLFMEQIRIVKEMRKADEQSGRTGDTVRPRFMVWENVVGALSSNKGEDFRTVLEEIAKIKDGNAAIPKPPKRWSKSGAIVGNGWSIAWRVHDAQFWGVPHRRRRIALVADFTGECAAEILFERQSVPGNIESGRTPQQSVAGGAQNYTRTAIGLHLTQDPIVMLDKTPCLSCGERSVVGVCVIPIMDKATRFAGGGDKRSNDGAGNGLGVGEIGSVAYTMTAADRHSVAVLPCISVHQNGDGDIHTGTVANTLSTNANASGRNAPLVCLAVDCRNHTTSEVSGTLQAKENGGQSLNYINPVLTYGKQSFGGYRQSNIGSSLLASDDITTSDLILHSAQVRRFTPLECERLQGYPDGWTDIGAWIDSKGKQHKESSDSAKYRALGNSIALPFWRWLLGRIMAHYNHPATLGSLFDGIGGFPLCWVQAGGVPVWASEIEEFPMAVTKKKFNMEE